MKRGANKNDQKRMARLYEEGMTATQISKKLKIHLNVVQNFEPEKKIASAKITKATNKKSKENHTKIMDAKMGINAPQGNPVKKAS